MTAPTIVWFRQDLRVNDQPALAAALAEGSLVPVYLLDDDTPGDRRIGAAQRWWLDGSLRALDAELQARGSRLVLARGRVDRVLPRLAAEVGATRVHAVAHHEPWWRQAEAAVAKQLDLQLHQGVLLAEPERVRTGSGRPFQVFAPFWRALSATMPPPEPQPAPDRIPSPDLWPDSETLDDWALTPTKPNWAAAFGDDWTPGEAGARQRLDAFLSRVAAYEHDRNQPGQEGTARLSPHLHFGEVSPATVWHALAGRGAEEKFLKELAWRDFGAGLIRAYPDYDRVNGRNGLNGLVHRTGGAAERDFRAWTRGQTGYPIVDAGMRQLWETGWMQNRARMITASFLVKHLLIDWQRGFDWFWDTLVDADYGNNAVNWQWIAGTGVDASPWHRIMAPLVQSRKFEAAAYIRRWVPELAHLGDEEIHDPHEAGIRVPDYPDPIIGHRQARERALAAERAARD